MATEAFIGGCGVGQSFTHIGEVSQIQLVSAGGQPSAHQKMFGYFKKHVTN